MGLSPSFPVPTALVLARGALTGLAKRPAGYRDPLPELRLSRPGVRIDPARVAAYAELCGFSLGGGGRGGALPLTYPHVLGFPLAVRIMAARAFPLPLAGLIHTGLTITAHHALRITDRPELTVFAADLRPHRRGTQVTLVTRAELGGEVVWEDHSTYLARHDQTPNEPPGVPAVETGPSDPAPELRPTPSGADPSAEGVTGLSGGGVAVEQVWRLPADLGRRHARVSGDYNPIHLHPWTARPFGFPHPIAHGMWTAARCAATDLTATTLTARFHHPIPLPSTVHFTSTTPTSRSGPPPATSTPAVS